MYGFFYSVPASSSPITSLEDSLEISLLLLLIICGIKFYNLGFGLIFGYYYRLGWTALGFNLFIVAFSI